ncbi:MAG TPA: helix-turn-helix transcriptional regulator, partial [Candidatus Kapabacteria bacterium]
QINHRPNHQKTHRHFRQEGFGALRNARGLTQEQLARKSKVTSDFISMLEHGRATVSLDNVVKMAKVLKVTASELINGCE